MIYNTLDELGRVSYICYFAPDWGCWIVAGNLGTPLTTSILMIGA
jgi:hypothetical protein